eukprot:3938366-Rhodomonas_salina.2
MLLLTITHTNVVRRRRTKALYEGTGSGVPLTHLSAVFSEDAEEGVNFCVEVLVLLDQSAPDDCHRLLNLNLSQLRLQEHGRG